MLRFQWHNSSGRTMALRLTQPLIEMSKGKANPFLILIPCIIDYVETNQLNAPKLYTSLFFFNNGSYMFRENMPKHVGAIVKGK
jgi:hypothetical protein